MNVLGEDGHQLGSRGAEIPLTTGAPNCADRLQAQEQGIEGQAGDHLHRQQRLRPPPCEEKRQSPLNAWTAWSNGSGTLSCTDGNTSSRHPVPHSCHRLPRKLSWIVPGRKFQHPDTRRPPRSSCLFHLLGLQPRPRLRRGPRQDLRSDQARTGKRDFTADYTMWDMLQGHQMRHGAPPIQPPDTSHLDLEELMERDPEQQGSADPQAVSMAHRLRRHR